MKSLGMGGAMPKTKPGDFERTAAILAALANPKESKKAVDAMAAAENAAAERERLALAAESNAEAREKAAQDAEAKATAARQAQADEAAETLAVLGKREVAVAERETAAAERETGQGARHDELARRERLLREAGVTGFNNEGE